MNARIGGLVLMLGVVSFRHAVAQERRGSADGNTQTVYVALPQPARFANVVLPAQRYRVSVQGDTITLGDGQTMVPLVTIAAKQTQTETPVAENTASIGIIGKNVILTVRIGVSVYTATGTLSAPPQDAAAVTLPQEDEKVVAATNEQPNDTQLVERVAQRLTRDLNSCGESAVKGRWATDDPRFTTCVCPQLHKWRLPHIAHTLRLHQGLVLNHYGFSYTATVDGHAKDCQVWAGSRPPNTYPQTTHVMAPPSETP